MEGQCETKLNVVDKSRYTHVLFRAFGNKHKRINATSGFSKGIVPVGMSIPLLILFEGRAQLLL